MGCTIEMLGIRQLPYSKGAIPEGMKLTALKGPDTLEPSPMTPVVTVGSFTLWPMSYRDNRMSFGMVMYDPKWNVAGTLEKKGARYICSITTQGSGADGTVTFHGQANNTVTMTVAEICGML